MFLTPIVATKNVNMWVGATWVYLLTLLVLSLAMLMFTLTCADDLYTSHWEIQHSSMTWHAWLLLDITRDLVTDPAYMHKEFYCLLIQYIAIARRLSLYMDIFLYITKYHFVLWNWIYNEALCRMIVAAIW